jgi:hypothetical protein
MLRISTLVLYTSVFSLFTAGCQTRLLINDRNPGSAASDSDPKLIKPTVKRIWIPRKIEDEGKVMEDGHWRYEVTGGSSWSR